MVTRNFVADATHDWGWLLVGGIVSVLLGIWAWAAPFYATQGIVAALGFILLIGGLVSLIQAIRFSKFGGMGWKMFQSLLAIAGGIIMLRHPAIGTLGVGLTICFYLFVSATAQFVTGVDLRPMSGSGWLIFSSIISFALGVILLFSLPVSAFYAPGIFLAVDLILGGFTAIGVSFRMRRLHKEAVEPSEVPRRAA